MKLKEFETYKDNMTDEEIIAFAKYGFICRQILNETFFKELKK